MMIKDIIHKKILSSKSKIRSWMKEKRQGLVFPFYSSVDIRDSGYKVVPVDANLFPAGFNNICDVDQEQLPPIANKYLNHYYKNLKKIILLTEEHTKNLYYWDNIFTLKEVLKNSCSQIVICVPGKKVTQPLTLESANGQSIDLQLLHEHLPSVDLIINNNDFSEDYEIPETAPINPSPKMGWRQRRKDWFFKEYNSLALEFSDLISIDPWHLTIKTEIFEPFNPDSPQTLSQLKNRLQIFLKDIKPFYDKINETPYAFLKNNSGTYGLGVTFVGSPEEIDHWNYKTRKKMKASKGGGQFSQLILQEGIPTILQNAQESVEPAIYMIGSKLVGGFLRTHRKKGVRENLNSPGAVYKKLCMSDLKVEIEGRDEENVYGWIAKLAVLALAFEMKKRS